MSNQKAEQEQKRQPPPPNPLGFLDIRRLDEKASIIRDLITSDKNNPTKARIPNVFGLVVLRMLGAWSTPTETITYTGNGERKSVPKTVAGLEEFFYDNYNTISQSYEGLSRGEYERAASSWLAQQQTLIQSAQSARMDEGAKKQK